jgi:uncharacterized repeat protein (TIGR02543 family)
MKTKVISLLLCLVMALSLVPAALAEGEDLSVYNGNEAVTAQQLEKNTGKTLTLAVKAEAAAYQWQIHIEGDLWANIYGETGKALTVHSGMVSGRGSSAEFRCLMDKTPSDTVTVTLVEGQPTKAPAPKAPEVLKEAQPVGEPQIVEPAVKAAPKAEEAPANDPAEGDENPVAPAEEGQTDESPAPSEAPSTFNIIINYVFENGTQAANPWTATVATGSTYTQDVQSPVVVGYTPSDPVVHVDTSEAKTYTVTYHPAEVEFTVKHYQQNVSKDEYTQVDTETKTGYTEAAVGEGLAKTDYTGFYSLLYDTTTTIAADGSTVVEVYYDRYYYLMNFDLDGGYGVEPIYARYGAPISIGTPEKPGYTFDGWDKTIPATMPAENRSYKAQWEAGDAAKVTIVVWGENADNEEYSFYHNSEIMAKPGEKLTLDSLQGKLICGKEEHTHSSDCGITCGHTHSLTCYGLSANVSSTNPNDNTALWCHSKPETYFSQLGLEDGYLYYDNENAMFATKDNYYLRFNGKYYKLTENQFNKLKGSEIGKTSDNTSGYPDYYYKYSIKTRGMSCTHTHDDSCYACGKTEHTHTSACYYNTGFMENPNLWKLVRSDEVTVAADGTTILNVYYDRVEFTLHFRKANSRNDDYGTITKKWGANIREAFNQKCNDAGTSNWSEKESAGGPWTSYLDIMPEKDMTFYANTDGYGTSTAYYYVEGLDGKDELYYTNVSTGTGYTVTEEEFINIDGFTFNASRSAKVGDKFDNAKFYYTRNSYNLKFYNYNAYVDGKGGDVQYEAPLSGYNFMPDYPADLEPNAYVFDGWYTTAGCYEGSEADLDTMTMPASDEILYAKWTPKTHTVKAYQTKDALENGKDALHTYDNVPHGTTVTPTPADPKRDPYKFVGWFYISDTGEEKAYNFSMPVNRDLNLYAKWSSNTLMTYTVEYKLEDGTEIAPPTTGSALAGTTKTFNAKMGTELNEGYQSGYFPTVSSHSITLDINDTSKNEFIFVYVEKPNVTYTVKYLEKGTGNELAKPKTMTTSDAVVTETFKQITGYAPDAYQKQLVLAADNNVIIFWYVKDDAHAPLQIIHWTQNIEGDGYTEYQSSTNLNVVIGTECSETPLTIPGFTYNGTKSNASGELTAAGLVLNLYYDRIEYPYEFRFLEQGTDKKLADAVTGNARYQAQVTQKAEDIPGYTLVSAENQAINIAIEDPANVASKNVKTFYYTEQTVEIKYEVVGPTASCGTLDNYQESQLKVITGEVKGSTPTANPGFKFVGWYEDKACTQPVNAAWVAANKLTPGKTMDYGTAEKPVMGYAAATYYAKFEYDVAELTIRKEGWNTIDENQSFLFTVKIWAQDGTGEFELTRFKVAIQGKNSVTIKGIPAGVHYTITEDSNWSWRYNAQEATTGVLNPGSNPVTITNSRINSKWLGGDAYCQNRLKPYLQ